MWDRRWVRIASSILVATVLWLSVKLVQPYQTQLQQPVAYRNLPPRLQLASPLPNTLGVTYQGRGHRLAAKALTIRRDTLVVDVSTEAIRRGFLVTAQLRNTLSADDYLRVIHLTPDTLALAFEQRIVKRVPVQARLDAQLADGYLPTAPLHLLPDSVQLLGTARQLANIRAWPTMPEVRTNLSSDLTVRLALQTDPSLVVSPPEVEATLHVAKFTEDSVQVRVRTVGLPPGQLLRLQTHTVTLRCRVPFQLAGSLRPEQFEVVVDLHDLDPAAQVLVPRVVRMPPFVRDIRLEPHFLRFVLTRITPS